MNLLSGEGPGPETENHYFPANLQNRITVYSLLYLDYYIYTLYYI